MGGAESSEAHGQGCSGCGIRLPPANPSFDFLKACADTSYTTYCFWTPADAKETITTSFNVGASGDGGSLSAGASHTVELGSRLFKYFRNAGYDEYYCAKCWVVRDVKRAESVLLEICGHGAVITKDHELVKCGKY